MPFPFLLGMAFFILETIMVWILLALAGLFEIAWVIGLKYSEGFSKPLPSIVTIIFLVLSMGLLSYCIKHLPVGTAYGIWTGIGAAGTAILGMVLFNEPREALRLFFIFLIIAGIIGLKITSS